MLKPAHRDLKVYTTGTFTTIIKLYKSLEPLETFPLSEYTVSLVIDGILTLKPGEGLTITENEIAVNLTPAQTGVVPVGARAHYYIKLKKGEEVVFPINGTISFVSP